jgi:DNA polymerase-3 subunit delta
MIIKAYDLNNAFQKIINYNLNLFYGENLGMMDDFKKEIIKKNKNLKLIRKNQDEILKNTELFFSELLNMSLFEEKKIFFISQADDKIIDLVKSIKGKMSINKIFLFSGILNKTSKLRTYFEKSKEYSVIPCYPDDEITIKKIITSRLANFQNLDRDCITAIQESSNNDRIKLNNELNKIETCFIDKKIDLINLLKLLNSNVNEDLNELTNAALSGNKEKTNKLLGETIIQDEKSIFFLNILNHRLGRLSDLISLSIKSNINQALNSIKPPIFWKDKNNFIEQSKKFNKEKINKILKETYNLELKIKSNSSYNSQILMKKLLIDICDLATS